MFEFNLPKFLCTCLAIAALVTGSFTLLAIAVLIGAFTFKIRKFPK